VIELQTRIKYSSTQAASTSTKGPSSIISTITSVSSKYLQETHQ